MQWAKSFSIWGYYVNKHMYTHIWLTLSNTPFRVVVWNLPLIASLRGYSPTSIKREMYIGYIFWERHFFCDSVRIFPNLYTLLTLLIKHIIRKLLQKALFWYQNELQGMKDNKVMHVNIKYVLMGNTGRDNFKCDWSKSTVNLASVECGDLHLTGDKLWMWTGY